MHRQNHAAILGALCLAVSVGVSACGKKDDARAGAAGGAVEANAPVRVADVTLGRSIGADKRVTNQSDSFGLRDTIYASVRTTGTASGARLTARWTFQDGQVVDERTETISPSGEAHTEFHIAKPSGWPTGKYTLRVLLDGSEVQTKEFTVQ